MSANQIDPNDPRLTDYALGELDDAQRAEIERLLENSPEANAAVDEILVLSGLLVEAFAREPANAKGLSEEQRAAVLAAAKNASSQPVAIAQPTISATSAANAPAGKPRRTSWGKRIAVLTGLAVCACVVLALVLPSRQAWESARKLSYRGPEDASQAGQWVAVESRSESTDLRGDASLPLATYGVRGVKTAPTDEVAATSAGELHSREAVLRSNVAAGDQYVFGETRKPVALREGTVDYTLPFQGRGRQIARRDLREAERVHPTEAKTLESAPPSRFSERADNTEAYEKRPENDFLSPRMALLSTFSVDVDTASYSNVRRFLTAGQLPPANAVRIEELINYFKYDDAPPAGKEPFAVNLEAGPCPWKPGNQLVRIGIKGREISKKDRPPTNLVFLLDVSGSMRDDNKLPLVKQAMHLLVDQMSENDRIAIVTYAGEAGMALDSTIGAKKDLINAAIDQLSAGGSTNGEAGIKLAYDTAIKYHYAEGSNRVLLCTDGDFNVGVSSDDELVKMIEEKAKQSKVFLSIFGFGMGNLKDAKLEKLADKGNGHYGYIDNIREANRVFCEDLTGTLYTIAKDVKLQIEFNPDRVGAYRLIGYENRVMPDQDFNDDTRDAGDIGAGHHVTALYELIPADMVTATSGLRYQPAPTGTQPVAAPRPGDAKGPALANELLVVSLRYKEPDGQTSSKIEIPLALPAAGTNGKSAAANPSRDFHFTAAVAGFGMLLGHSRYRGAMSFDTVLELAQSSLGDDPSGSRHEFIELAKKARSLSQSRPAQPAGPSE